MDDESNTARKRKADVMEGQDDFYISDFGDIVQLRAMVDKKVQHMISIHGNLLHKHAKFFRDRKGRVGFAYDNSRHCRFQMYARFLYSRPTDLESLAKGYTPATINNEPLRSPRMIEIMVWAWELGLAIGDVQYMNCAVDAILRTGVPQDLGWVPSALERLEGTKLDCLFDDTGVAKMTTEDAGNMESDDKVSKADVVRVLMRVLSVRDRNEEMAMPTFEDRAKYHVDEGIHGSQSQRDAIAFLKLRET